MNNFPSGTVTFLFTDIEGSTKLAQEYPDEWESLRARHHAILQFSMDAHNGYVFQIIGDAFCVAFHTALDALSAAIQTQQSLQQEAWSPARVKVRMGINTGAAQVSSVDDYLGIYRGYTVLARVQRVMSVGYGGQILLSNSSFELVRGELPHNVSLRDMGEHRLKGLLNPEHLWQVSVSDLQQDFPPLQSLNKIPNNLPVQLTSFVGREKEIDAVKQELSSHRLVTLTGSGGTGKTRLSLQIAAEVIDHYPDGVWFIELAPLADPDLIPHTILAVLHFGEQAGKTPFQVLEEQFKNKKLLLILDNCEHLIEASAKVAHGLLMSAPGIKILASSREALGVKGELAWPVPSLTLPDPKSLPEIEQLTQYESVRLFIDRALLVQPHFKVDKTNAPAIAQICSRLDGIPLAMELAAARLKMLSVDQIAARLDDRFRLLTGGARTALPRHQTLRAMIDWSYDLLAENERLLLRRLAVFAGGWSLELAEQICSDDKLNSSDILDMLGHLVDKSLVAVDEDKTGTRYRILETVRQYAREKLLETDENIAIRNKHRDVYLAFLEENESEIVRAQQRKWQKIFETEIDNFRAAFTWSLEHKDAELALRFCTGLGNFWGKNNHVAEAALTSKQALALVNEDDSLKETFWYASTLLAYVVFTANVEWKAFSDPSFMPLFEQTHNLFSSINIYTTTGPVLASSWLAGAYIDLNELSLAEKYLFELYEKVKAADYPWGIAWTKKEMARLSLSKGDVTSWLRLLQEALELFTELGDEWVAKNISETLIWQKYLSGEFEDAARLLRQSILIYEKDDEQYRIARCYRTLGNIAVEKGEYEAARGFFLDAANIYRYMGLNFRGESTLVQEAIVFLHYKEGGIEGIKDQYQALIAQLKDLSNSYLLGFIHAHYAVVCLYENHLSEARKSLKIAFDVMKKTASEEDICLAYFGFGELARLENNHPQAIKDYRASLQYANSVLNYKSFAEIFDGIAKTEYSQSNFDKATRLFGASEALRKKMGAVIHPVDQPDYNKHIELLHEKLSPNELESAWAEGAKMSIEEMFVFAIQEGV
jgi:predicted ATPase/class 3 adenylate cyclase